MSRRGNGACLNSTDTEGFPVLEQMVELRPVCQEATLQVENGAKVLLHPAYADADTRGASHSGFDVGARGDMIGVGVGLEYPPYVQFLVFEELHDLVGIVSRSAAGGGLVMHDAVDYGCLARSFVPDHV